MQPGPAAVERFQHVSSWLNQPSGPSIRDTRWAGYSSTVRTAGHSSVGNIHAGVPAVTASQTRSGVPGSSVSTMISKFRLSVIVLLLS